MDSEPVLFHVVLFFSVYVNKLAFLTATAHGKVDSVTAGFPLFSHKQVMAGKLHQRGKEFVDQTFFIFLHYKALLICFLLKTLAFSGGC